MNEVTITVCSEVMWKTSLRLHDKLGRDSSGSEILTLTEEEYGIEYGCVVGEQQYDHHGAKINQRDLTFNSEPEATLFLLRWA
jgi:hypothetical protein